MVLSGIYILDMKGKVLISRNYRGDIETNVIDKFIGLVMDREEDGTLTPLLQTEDTTFAFIRRNNLYVVATTKKNSNIAMIFCLLHKICAVSAESSTPYVGSQILSLLPGVKTSFGLKLFFANENFHEKFRQIEV